MTWRNRVLELRQVQAAELKQNPRNFRRHPERQSKALRGVLEEVGIAGALLAYNHPERGLELIDGHLRQEQGGVWPVLVLDVTENEANILLATHDPIGMMAEQDAQTLRDLVAGLEVKNAELAAMLEELSPEPPAALGDPEAIPEVKAQAVSQTGDLWLLGGHRVLCGDSTRAEDVERLLGGEVPLLMVTDPPYGVEYDPKWRAIVNRDGPNSKRAVGKVTNDDRADWREAYSLFPGDVAYVWHPPGALQGTFLASLEAAGLEVRMTVIWAKNQFPFGRGHYHVKHEPCFYAVRSGRTAHWAGDRKQTTLWEIDKPRKSETGHSTQKPIECMARPIRNHEAPSVYDPFLGSGTTLIAAEELGRTCYGMEISPQYVDVIVKRWQTFTGRQATLEATGQTFSQVEVDRA